MAAASLGAPLAMLLLPPPDEDGVCDGGSCVRVVVDDAAGVSSSAPLPDSLLRLKPVSFRKENREDVVVAAAVAVVFVAAVPVDVDDAVVPSDAADPAAVEDAEDKLLAADIELAAAAPAEEGALLE